MDTWDTVVTFQMCPFNPDESGDSRLVGDADINEVRKTTKVIIPSLYLKRKDSVVFRDYPRQIRRITVLSIAIESQNLL